MIVYAPTTVISATCDACGGQLLYTEVPQYGELRSYFGWNSLLDNLGERQALQCCEGCWLTALQALGIVIGSWYPETQARIDALVAAAAERRAARAAPQDSTGCVTPEMTRDGGDRPAAEAPSLAIACLEARVASLEQAVEKLLRRTAGLQRFGGGA